MLGTRVRKTTQSIPTRRCRMCRSTVAVGPDGRCGLGHQVADPSRIAPAAPSAPPAAPSGPPAAPSGPPQARPPGPTHPPTSPSTTAPHRPAVQVTRGPAQTTPPAPAASAPPPARAAVAAQTDPAAPVQPPAPAAAPSPPPAPTAPTSSTFAHPYDEVLSWSPAPAPAGPARHANIDDALDALLALHDEPAPPARTAPAPQIPPLPAPPVPAAPVASALDVVPEQLPTPPAAYAPTSPVRHEFVDEQAEEREEEGHGLRRRVLTLVGGGLLAMAAGFGAAFVLPV